MFLIFLTFGHLVNFFEPQKGTDGSTNEMYYLIVWQPCKYARRVIEQVPSL